MCLENEKGMPDPPDWMIKEVSDRLNSIEVDDIVVLKEAPTKEYPGKLVIHIEPGMAFGTGRHPTTQLCMQVIRRKVRPGDKVLDFGCGSGILGILAAKLGASEVLGIDNFKSAIENANRNVRLNDVEYLTTFEDSDNLRADYYDLVVANLNCEAISELLPSLMGAVRPGGVLIFSGILYEQTDEISELLSNKGFLYGSTFQITMNQNWTCYTIRKEK